MRRGLLSLMLVAFAAVGVVARSGSGVMPAAGAAPRHFDAEEARPRPVWERTPGVDATFLRDSYPPGSTATLVLWHYEKTFSVRFFRAGRETGVPVMRSNTWMQGTPVSRLLRLGPTVAHTPVSLTIGDWPSGIYFARLSAPGRIGFAPFVVRPRVLGEHPVAVVVPTYTWQAYNFRDDNHDGAGDTWYADWKTTSIKLIRPFLARGVPPHFRSYDYPFLKWLHRTGKQVDFLSDSDLDMAPDAATLARAYRLIVFSSHNEYATARGYNLVERYRDRGGHLMFLSANNFFWKVVRHGDTLTKVARWRDLGRPEAALVGVEFISNDRGSHQGQYTVRNISSAKWLFSGTGLSVGSQFGWGGIEIDHIAPSSPPGITAVADIRDLMGPGKTSQMTYYETPAGAKVFAAGAFTLTGSDPLSCRILQHLWNKLAAAPSGGTCARWRPGEPATPCGQLSPAMTLGSSTSSRQCAGR